MKKESPFELKDLAYPVWKGLKQTKPNTQFKHRALRL